MKIYIWEGNGISDAYHDDGTLVVLANTPEEARKIVRNEKQEKQRQEDLRNSELKEAAFKAGGFTGEDAAYLWRRADERAMTKKMDEIDTKYPLVHEYGLWDGEESALDREPDRVLEIGIPQIVAFNGGGYD